MNIRESGAHGARRFTTVLGVVGAALASIIGVSVWAGTSASASSTSGTTTVQGGDDGQRHDDGFGGSNGFINPGQGGNSHGNSNGS